MTRHLDADRILEDWLADLPNSLPDRVVNRLVDDLDRTPQWRRFGLPRRETMNRIVLAAGSVAAVVLIAAIGIGLVSGGGLFGPGATPAPTSTPEPTVAPTPEPTVAPSPTASPRPATEGDLQAGTYAFHPFPSPDEPLSVTFTVPDGWGMVAGSVLYPEEGTTGIQFEDVTSLNADPCEWEGTSDDVDVGTTVDELVEALTSQTAYEVTEPVDVTIGGYSGTRVDIVHPTGVYAGQESVAPGCDLGEYRLWSTALHGPHPLYGQGPAHRWQANILDVDGTRLVVVAMDFPDTAAEDRAEMDAIVDSLVIEP